MAYAVRLSAHSSGRSVGMTGGPSSRRPGWRSDLVVAAVLTVLLLGPALLPGYVLRGDMVFVPRQPWKDAWLGLDGSFPRSVPMDALVSVLTAVVPGWVVQKALLVGALVGGGVGAGRLVAGASAVGRAGAVTLFLWNPYVAERLLIGQWAVVLGYAALPWVVLAAVRCADGKPRGVPVLAGALAVAAVASPSSGLMAILVAVLVVVSLRAWRAAAYAVGLGALVNLPWVLPALWASSGSRASVVGGADAFRAFAARAESDAGLLASLASLGGIWKTSVVPAERTSAVVVLLAVLVTVVALLGLRAVADPRQRRLVPGLLGVAAVSLLLAALPEAPGAAEALGRAGEAVPGVGLLRDSHRSVGPAVLVLLPGIAAAVDAVRRGARPGREAWHAAAVALAAAPVLLLPSLAWGSWGDLRAVDYPAEWQRVADLVAAEDDATMVVLPWTGSYRGFAWNDRRAVLDPAPRFFRGEVLIDDRVLLDGLTLPGESARTRAVTAALEDADPAAALRELGVRWVLVERGHLMGTMGLVGTVPDGTFRHRGPGLILLDLGPKSPEGTDN